MITVHRQHDVASLLGLHTSTPHARTRTYARARLGAAEENGDISLFKWMSVSSVCYNLHAIGIRKTVRNT